MRKKKNGRGIRKNSLILEYSISEGRLARMIQTTELEDDNL